MAKWQIIEEAGKTYWYVSKDGDDTNGSGTTTAPYATVNKARQATTANNQVIVIGSGIWQETLAASSYVNVFLGEQNCIIDGSSTNKIILKTETLIKNIKIQNYVSTKLFTTHTAVVPWENCFIENVALSDGNDYSYFKNCIIIGLTRNVNYSRMDYENCYIKNCWDFTTNPTTIKIINCIMDTNPNFRYIDQNGEFDYNVIIGTLYYGTTVFGGAVRDLAWLQANTTTNQHSISSDPQFNSITYEDYTVAPTSPCLYAGKNREHIGPLGMGYAYNGLSTEFLEASGATWTNLTCDANGVFYQTDPLIESELETAMITFPKIVKINKNYLLSNFEYGPTGIPTEIVGYDYNSGSTDTTQHYDFLIKYGMTIDEWSGATYKSMMFDESIMIDNSDRGTGDDAYILSEGAMMTMRYCSLKIKLKVL